MDSIISAKGFTKKYSKFTLDVPELDIPKGFATALIGANGSEEHTSELQSDVCSSDPSSGC